MPHKLTAAEKRARKMPGGSNVGKYRRVKPSNFAGKAGGAPAGSYPINSIERGRAALRYAHYAPKPQGIKNAVYKKYPSLRPTGKPR